MASARDELRALPRRARRLPIDLALVLTLVVATNVAVLAPVVQETVLRPLFAFTFVLFVPGYALVAAAFPGHSGDGDSGPATRRGDSVVSQVRDAGLTGLERVVLSTGASLTVTSVVALLLNFTPWGVSLLPALFALSAVTVTATSVGALRRRALPAAARFRVPYRNWLRRARNDLFVPETRASAILGAILVLSLVAAVSSGAYVVTTPGPDESFTEFYLLTERPDGELIAADHPQTLSANESTSLVVGVENAENHPQEYTVAVEIQRVESSDGSTTVAADEVLGRYQTGRLANGERWRRSHGLTPAVTGDGLRLTYLLYRGEAPADPDTESAYRDLHLWVDVTG